MTLKSPSIADLRCVVGHLPLDCIPLQFLLVVTASVKYPTPKPRVRVGRPSENSLLVAKTCILKSVLSIQSRVGLVRVSAIPCAREKAPNCPTPQG